MDDRLVIGHGSGRALSDAERVEALVAWRRRKPQGAGRWYPHMCRDGHAEIGHATDDEMCPVCKALGALDTERTAHEATRALARELADTLLVAHDESYVCGAHRVDKALARARAAGLL